MLLKPDTLPRPQARRIVNQHLDLMLDDELSHQPNNLPTLPGLYRLFDTFSILATIMNLPNTLRSHQWDISQVIILATIIKRRKST
jgi:hypothetical protein